jgi:NAD(P)H-dependent FMN reductase
MLFTKCLGALTNYKTNNYEKIIAFGASSSKKSINKQLATYAAGQFKNASVEVLDLNDYEMPIYSMDKEAESGIPQLATDFITNLEPPTYL